MNKSIKFLTVVVFLGFINLLHSQTEAEKSWSIEARLGYANTLHWNSPIAIVQYYEGGRILIQSPNNELQYELSMYRYVMRNHYLKIGIGLTNFSFRQIREAWTGILPFPWEVVHEAYRFQFLSIALGHRFYIKELSRISFMWDNAIVFDKILQDDYQINWGLSYKTQIGMIYRLTNNISILTDVFGRTAIISYNKFVNYFPRMYGFQAGLGYSF